MAASRSIVLIREEHCELADGVKMSLGWNWKEAGSVLGALSTEFLKWCQFALESVAAAAANAAVL